MFSPPSVVSKLNDQATFAIEAGKRRVRLIAYSGTIEVCRKETPGNLRRFIESGEGRLFKGRLQLVRVNGDIGIEVTGQLTVVISKEEFLKTLKDLKA